MVHVREDMFSGLCACSHSECEREHCDKRKVLLLVSSALMIRLLLHFAYWPRDIPVIEASQNVFFVWLSNMCMIIALRLPLCCVHLKLSSDSP